MIFMNSIDTLLKIILYQHLSSSSCILFINGKLSNNINLPIGLQVVNIAVNSNENSTSISNKVFRNYGCQIFILNVENPTVIFSNIERGLKLQNETFTRRKYIVINNFHSTDSVLSIFKTKEINFVSDILILGLKNQILNTNISVLNKREEIYYLWSHEYIGLQRNDVYELDNWFSVNKSFLKNTNVFPDKLTNQYGRSYKIGFFEYIPYIIYENNNQKYQNGIAGLEGTILHVFLTKHNISMEPFLISKDYWGDVFDNGTVYGLRGALYEDKVDIGVAAFFATDRMYRYYGMTIPILRIGITCLVPAPKLTAGWLVPILVYSSLMWKLIFGAYIVIIIFIYITEVGFMSKYLKYVGSHKYILLMKKFGEIVFAIFTQYVSNRNFWKGYSGTGFLMMIIFVTFFLCRSYESGLASIMTIPRYEKSINTADDFFESNITWGGIQVADWIMHWETDREESYRRAYRRYLAAPSKALLKKLLATGNFGLLIERVSGDHYHFPFSSLENTKDIRLMKEDIHREYSVFLLRKSSPLIPLLDKFIFKIRESGITSYWLDEATRLVMTQSLQREVKYLSRYNSEDHQVVVLRLAHVAGIFCVVIAGNLISILIFCLEIYYWKCHT